MSVLLLGVSHRSAPVAVLEKVAISDTERPKLLERMVSASHVSEAMIVSTCNRVEIYAVVDAFHGGVADLTEILTDHAGLPLRELTRHAYVYYSEAAVEHLFAVASGLDSLVVGEQQILGQIRGAYGSADAQDAVGRTLHDLAQRALRVGKRVHAETGIDRAGASVVSVALDRAHAVLGSSVGRKAVVVGAGAMGSLATSQLVRAGIADIAVVNRTVDRAERLAQTASGYGVAARAGDFADLPDLMSTADIVISCTGAVGSVITAADARQAVARRSLPARSGDAPLVICDLGLPRDVEPSVAGLPGVVLIDIEALQRNPASVAARSDTEAARAIVAAELAEYLAGQQVAAVTPTVAALRRRAADVVNAELLRLDTRLPSLSAAQRDEVGRTVRRVVDKLLHAPTVRVKQLATTPGGNSYAEALRELFELDPNTAAAVAIPRATDVTEPRRMENNR